MTLHDNDEKSFVIVARTAAYVAVSAVLDNGGRVDDSELVMECFESALELLSGTVGAPEDTAARLRDEMQRELEIIKKEGGENELLLQAAAAVQKGIRTSPSTEQMPERLFEKARQWIDAIRKQSPPMPAASFTAGRGLHAPIALLDETGKPLPIKESQSKHIIVQLRPGDVLTMEYVSERDTWFIVLEDDGQQLQVTFPRSPRDAAILPAKTPTEIKLELSGPTRFIFLSPPSSLQPVPQDDLQVDAERMDAWTPDSIKVFLEKLSGASTVESLDGFFEVIVEMKEKEVDIK